MNRRTTRIGVAMILVCSGAVAGCGSADDPGPSTRPTSAPSSASPTSGTPASLVADGYCGTLGNIVRFANGPGLEPEVAKQQFGPRLTVLTDAYRELADVAPHRDERRRWARLADVSAAVIDFYEASGRNLSADGMILKLAQWKARAERVLLANQDTTERECGITADRLAGYPIRSGAQRGQG